MLKNCPRFGIWRRAPKAPWAAAHSAHRLESMCCRSGCTQAQQSSGGSSRLNSGTDFALLKEKRRLRGTGPVHGLLSGWRQKHFCAAINGLQRKRSTARQVLPLALAEWLCKGSPRAPRRHTTPDTPGAPRSRSFGEFGH